MTSQVRCLRRCALLLFPGESLNHATVERIAAEGFTDLGIAIVPDHSGMMPGQGFVLDQAKELADLAQQHGLGLIAFTGYMKYQYDLLAREPERAMRTYGGAAKLDSDLLTANWLCPFRPENKQYYLDLLAPIARLPALRELHLNDEAMLGFDSGAIGCYCDYCVERFRQRHGQPPPREPAWNDPLWWAWIEYRLEAWTAVHAELREAIKREQPALRVGIQHSPIMPCHTFEPWKSGISLARDAQAMDMLATDPYHYNHADLIKHRPHRRILGEGTRRLVGACLDRGVNIYPQAFMPPGQAPPMGYQDGLLAGIVPFALGADTITPYAYELMKIIPGFFEGLQDARRLEPNLARGRPYAFATVLLPFQTEVFGHGPGPWGRDYFHQLTEGMYHTGLPWRWFWDQRLDDAADQLNGPLIVPDAHCLTCAQHTAIQAVAQRGEGVLWIGNQPDGDWTGQGPCAPATPFERGVFELEVTGEHPLLDGVTDPILLGTRAGGDGPDGQTIAAINGRPALKLIEDGPRRQAWLAGWPLHSHVTADSHLRETGGTELLNRLLRWLGGEPLVRLDPYPPDDAYRRLRPSDRRNVPTLELLPLTTDGGLLAVIFPYTPVSANTALRVTPPAGRSLGVAHELWHDRSPLFESTLDGTRALRIPLHIAGEQTLLALSLTWQSAVSSPYGS